MKKPYILFSIITSVAIMQCAVEKKMQYNIPNYVPEERKAEFLANLEKGRLLFKMNCSECHGIFGKGKDSIPNFSNQDLADYTVAFKANDQNNHAVVKKLLPEEMSMILTFLQYRKTDSLPQHAH